MTTATVNSLFYDLTKEEMETLSPPDLRLIIRKAYDNMRAGMGLGMGPGPSMQRVIDHYNDERNYLMIRGVSDDQIVHDSLDRLLAYKDSGGAGSMPWTLPSIIDGSKQRNSVGQYGLDAVRRALPDHDKVLTEAGW